MRRDGSRKQNGRFPTVKSVRSQISLKGFEWQTRSRKQTEILTAISVFFSFFDNDDKHDDKDDKDDDDDDDDDHALFHDSWEIR